jgi:hypothetical protein
MIKFLLTSLVLIFINIMSIIFCCVNYKELEQLYFIVMECLGVILILVGVKNIYYDVRFRSFQ